MLTVEYSFDRVARIRVRAVRAVTETVDCKDLTNLVEEAGIG